MPYESLLEAAEKKCNVCTAPRYIRRAKASLCPALPLQQEEPPNLPISLEFN